jgi:methylmalonyl-CoA/ethylmalonyl-CoA epimerase
VSVRVFYAILEALGLAAGRGWGPFEGAGTNSRSPGRFGILRRWRLEMGDVTEFRVAMTVEDFDEAVSFYRDALGLTQLEDWSDDAGRVILLDAGRATLELLDEPQAAIVDDIEVGARVAGTVRLAFEVSDTEETAQRLAAAGAAVLSPLVITPWGDHNARVRAPDGMQMTLFSSPDPQF